MENVIGVFQEYAIHILIGIRRDRSSKKTLLTNYIRQKKLWIRQSKNAGIKPNFDGEYMEIAILGYCTAYPSL